MALDSVDDEAELAADERLLFEDEVEDDDSTEALELGLDPLFLSLFFSEPVLSMSDRLASTYSCQRFSKLAVNLAATPSDPSTRSAEIEMVKSPPYEQIPIPSVPFPACGGNAVHRTTSFPARLIRCFDGQGTLVTTAVKHVKMRSVTQTVGYRIRFQGTLGSNPNGTGQRMGT